MALLSLRGCVGLFSGDDGLRVIKDEDWGRDLRGEEVVGIACTSTMNFF